MKTVKFIAGADLHLKSAEPFGVVNDDNMNTRVIEKLAILEGMLQDAEKQEVDFLLLLGDMFDSHNPSKKVLQAFAALVADYSDILIYYVPGNHDSVGEVSALASEGLLAHANFRVIEEVESEEINGHTFLFAPYYAIGVASMMVEEDEEISAFFTHGYLSGADISKSNRALKLKGKGIVTSYLPGKYVILGDIHKHQVVGDRAIYPGELARVDLSDSELTPGYLYCELDEKDELSYKHIPVDDISIKRDTIQQWDSLDPELEAVSDADMGVVIDSRIKQFKNAEVVELKFVGHRYWIGEVPFRTIRKKLREAGVRKVLLPTTIVPDRVADVEVLSIGVTDASKSLSGRWQAYATAMQLDDSVLGLGAGALDDADPFDFTAEYNDPYYVSNLAVRGLGRCGETEINFDGPDAMIMILGKNLDSAKQDSNGSGKTSLLDAISWTVTGSIPGKNRMMQTFGRRNYQGAVSLLSGHENVLRIERGAKSSKAYLRVYLNGDLQHTPTMAEAQTIICNELAIPDVSKKGIDAFYNIAYLSYAFYKAFAGQDTDSSDRIEMLSKFLNLDPISVVIDKLRKEEYKKVKDAFSHATSQYEVISGQIDALGSCTDIDDSLPASVIDANSLLTKLQRRTEKDWLDTTNKIADINLQKDARLAYYTLKDKMSALATREITDLDPIRQRYDEITEEVSKLSTLRATYDDLTVKVADIISVQDDLAIADTENVDLQTAILNLRTDMGDYDREIKSIEDTLGKSLECPSCGAHLMHPRGKGLELVNADKLRADLDKVEKKQHADSEKLRVLQQKLKDNNDVKTQLLNKSAMANTLRDKYRETLDAIESIEKQAKALDTLEEQGQRISNEIKIEKKSVQKQIDTLLKNNPGADTDKSDELKEYNDKLVTLDAALRRIIKLIARVQEYHKVQKNLATKRLILDKTLKDARKKKDMYDILFIELQRFRMTQLVQAAPTIEQYTNDNLNLLGSDLRMRMLFDERGQKQITQQLEIMVIDEEGVERPLSTYSSGERERISLASTFAQRQMSRELAQYRVHWCGMDEVWEGLDASGRDALLAFLGNQPGQHMMISHGAIAEQVPQCIYAVRKDGVTTFEE